MDDLAKLILSDLRTCTKEYGEEFDQREVSISVYKDGYDRDSPWVVRYTVGGYGDRNKTEGADLYKCITEYMRRKGWTEANKPMVLIEAPKKEEQEHGTFVVSLGKSNDDVPF